MKKVDILLQKIESIDSSVGVHFWLNGYCAQCKGKCKAQADDDIVIIENDIPRDYKFIPPDLSQYGYKSIVGTETKKDTHSATIPPQEVKNTNKSLYERLFESR